VQAEANTNIGRNMEADACAAEAMRLSPRGSPRWFGAAMALGQISSKLGSHDRLIALSQELFRIEVRGAPDDYAICASNVAVHLFVGGEAEVAEHLLSAAEAAATSVPVPAPVMLRSSRGRAGFARCWRAICRRSSAR